MLDYSAARLSKFSATWVIKIAMKASSFQSKHSYPLHDAAEEIIIGSMLKPFEKTEEYFYFHHEEDVSHHVVYQACNTVFQDPDTLTDVASELAQLLYGFCESPKILGGEFFVGYFEDLSINGESCQALAMWKVHTREPYLKTDELQSHSA
ncbi:MAG: hypothetical protein R2778_13130 [Saprospiraceae bacterium]